MIGYNNSLSDRDLAFLANHLQIPTVIRDLLESADRKDISDEMHFALHDAISDMQPDSALLAMALSARHLVIAQGAVTPSLRVLDMECRRLIEEYGSVWIRHAYSGKIDEEEILKILVHIPEDLESLADLLQGARSAFEASGEKFLTLSDILNIQAGAHALIAETFIEAANNAAPQNAPKAIFRPDYMNDNNAPAAIPCL